MLSSIRKVRSNKRSCLKLQKIVKIELYQKENGEVPVSDFIKSLDNKKLQAKAYSDIKLLQEHRYNLHEPYVKPIKGKKTKDYTN